GNLTQMHQLSAHGNQLEGPLPSEIGDCTELTELTLSNNQFSEAIPDEIGNCTKLYRIDFQNNQFSGTIPESIGNLINLAYFRLNQNQLFGEIPDTLSNCTALKTLLLSENQLTGNIPLRFENLINLTGLYVTQNQLSGIVPANIANILTLEKFSCAENQFTDFPDLSGIPSLIQLHIYNNQLTFEDIESNLGVYDYWYFPQDSVGEEQTISTWLGANLTLSVSVGGSQNLYQWYRDDTLVEGADEAGYLMNPVVSADTGSYICEITNTLATQLTLYSRPIHVIVADAITGLQQDSLALVDFYQSMNGENWTNHNNWLTAPLSTWYGIFVDVNENRVTSIDLHKNGLEGTIPMTFGNLNALTSITLHNNNLTGEIPSGIYDFDKLVYINLSENALTGSISPNIENLIHLERLYLNSNELTGEIPTTIGNLEYLRTLNLRHNQLEGILPDELYNLINLETINLSFNQIEGTISGQIGNLVNLTEFSVPLNYMTGPIPDEMAALTQLKYLFLHDNQFTQLPDLSAIESLQQAVIQNNQFTFEDIEPNIGIESFTYAPQDSAGEVQDTTVTEGSELTISVDVGGQSNTYRWMKDGLDIGLGNGNSFYIDSVVLSDAGEYLCMVTNATVPDLVLYTRPITVLVEPASDVEGTNGGPDAFALHQNFPNPFNPETKIYFDVKESCDVVLTIFNLLGEEVQNLVEEHYQPGRYHVNFNAGGFDSGLYFYSIRMGEFHTVRKMIVME
ncbi:immunoglobulin domain-containing protein, partial [bacterium]